MIEILYEDNHLIAVQKPFGIPAQADLTGDKNLFEIVKDHLKAVCQKPGNVYLGLLHRLDRPTAGVMLMAKTSKAAARMSEQFRERQVQKTYYAITNGLPENKTGRLVHYLKKTSQNQNIVRAYTIPQKSTDTAILDYTVVDTNEGMGLIRVNPITGRQHQIRVQLATVGCALVGDLKYGAQEPLPDRSIGLLAAGIEFLHPITKRKVNIQARWPNSTVWNQFPDPRTKLND